MFDLQLFREIEFERREQHLKHAEKQKLRNRNKPSSQLHIVYVMTHVGICGGTKIILEHANNLIRIGLKVTLVSHFDKPKWFPIDKNVKYIKVPFEIEVAEGVPNCDVIVATYWREIYSCIERNIAPVVYFEQGDFHLFDWENVDERKKEYIYKQFQVVPFIYTVSKGAAEQIKQNFGRDASIINNAIDKSIFNYNERKDKKVANSLIIIGSQNSEFKRIDDIISAYKMLKEQGYGIDLNWITPDEPLNSAGNIFVNPPQKCIGKVLRESDIFISASRYESFSLPPLEAMASGCTVITTGNSGVLEYAKDNYNSLILQDSNPINIYEQIIKLIKNEKLKKNLSKNGVETAKVFNWDVITPKIIDYYREIAKLEPIS